MFILLQAKQSLQNSSIAKSQIRRYFSHQGQKKKFFKVKDGVKVENDLQVYPNQYPKKPLNDNAPIISRERNVISLTPKHELPKDMLMEGTDYAKEIIHKNQWASPENAYALNIGLIGPVNAGKSELFGALSHRISAVSPKAATTTELVEGFKSFEKDSDEGIKNIQLKYIDTPGLMYKKEGFISKGWKVLSEIDFSLLVVDSAKRFDEMIKQSIKRLEKHRDYKNFMKALVLNKVDLVDNRRKFDSLIREIEKYGKFDKIFYTSATTGYGIDELQDYLIGMAKKREWDFPPETKTNRTEIQVCEEMLREGLFLRLYKEVPHDITIECTSFTPLSNGKDKLLFTVYVDSENQQRMIIGKKGSNLEEAITRMKVLYAKGYQKQAEILVSVRIRNRFKKRFGGREELDADDEERESAQRMRILEETLTFKRDKSGLAKIMEESRRRMEKHMGSMGSMGNLQNLGDNVNNGENK